jgi:hypothetical protein
MRRLPALISRLLAAPEGHVEALGLCRRSPSTAQSQDPRRRQASGEGEDQFISDPDHPRGFINAARPARAVQANAARLGHLGSQGPRFEEARSP